MLDELWWANSFDRRAATHFSCLIRIVQTKFQHDLSKQRRVSLICLYSTYIFIHLTLSSLHLLNSFTFEICRRTLLKWNTDLCVSRCWQRFFFLFTFYIWIRSICAFCFFITFRDGLLVVMSYPQFKVRWDQTEFENIAKWPWPRDFWSSYDFEVRVPERK